MDFGPEDQEIIRLLNKIKDAEGDYPEHMLVARRHSYLKRMGEISLGIPADFAIRNTAQDVRPSHISPATSTLVETALVVAIIAEASAVAFFYRNHLADFFRRIVVEPRVQEVMPPSVVPTFLEIEEVEPSLAPVATLPSATVWSLPSPTGTAVTSTGTPVPSAVNHGSNTPISTATGMPSLLNTANTGEPNVLNSTPGPSNDSSGGNNANNGNHYGQTPKPERTKENGNNPPPKDNNDPPPKDQNDQPPKDNEGKPPKEDKPPKENNDKPPKN